MPLDQDRKEITRIFFQMLGLYMSLGVIAIAGVAGRSVFTTLPEAAFARTSISTERAPADSALAHPPH
jgi:hypothetical protein